MAALLLPELARWVFFLKIGEEELVEHAAHLDAEHRVVVARVEVVGHRDDPDAGVLQVVEDQEHERVVTGEPGEVVDEYDVERVLLRNRAQGG